MPEAARFLGWCVVLSLVLGTRAAAAAPAPPPTRDSTCTYRRCALAVVPAWNGLDVVRGESGERIARLGFFWTGDVSPVFAAEPHARSYAERAVHTRRMAALFTDAGAALLVAALATGLSDSADAELARGLAIGGAVAFAIGVPLQFAADGHLSRAVWWHNSTLAP